MGFAIYVTFDRDIPGVNGWDIGGKLLAANIEKLDQIATRRGARTFTEFQSMSVSEYSSLVGTDDDPVEPPSASFYEDMGKHMDEQAADELRELMGKIHTEINTAIGALRSAGPPVEEWFAPSEGLATVETLLEAIRTDPEDFERAADLLDDLTAVRHCLQAAEQHGARFHLSLDF